MSQTGVIILAHGSRGERGTVEVPETLRRLANGLKPLIPTEVEIVGAALQFNRPTLEEAVEILVGHGAQHIVVMPYFLFSGRHITEDIPRIIENLEHRYPGIQFTVTSTLGADELFTGLVAKRIVACMPGLSPGAQIADTSPQAIEQQSMEIVEGLVPALRNMPEEEQAVVKRVIHASGDPQVADLMKLSTSAIPDGLSALVEGSPIFTDVHMVSAGINRQLAKACGCSLYCAMDEINGQQKGRERDTTRAAAAMYRLGKRLNGAIAAIGNAPTALLALLVLIDNGGIKPALIVGMPVGFVRAKESKEELMKRDVPYITVVGTRGGSALAAATVNALLKMAVERNGHGWDY
jgi:precorrin-8X/cobalt-precorrin-8 methylmutase